MSTAPTARPRAHVVIRYTALRLGIFAVCFAVLWLLGYLRLIPVVGATGAVFLLALAAVISAPLSYVLLDKHRNAMSAQLVASVESARQRLAENRSQEDRADDSARARQSEG